MDQHICAPYELLQGKLASLGKTASSVEVVLEIRNDYEQRLLLPGIPAEVFLIQRILTLARSGVPLRIVWDSAIARSFAVSAPLFPLLAVLVSLQGAIHQVNGLSSTMAEEFALAARKVISQYKLKKDFFSTTQILLCDDSRGYGRPVDLYDQTSGHLRSREDFETLVLEVLSTQLGEAVRDKTAYQSGVPLGVIVAELFENTHIHGRLSLNGGLLGTNSIRGLVFKRVTLDRPPPLGSPKGTPAVSVDFLEVSVFDTGIGYFTAFTREQIAIETELGFEWKVLHNCLERHYHTEIEDKRPGHRAMGLAEVLRVIQALKGRIDVRTGRLFAYRTFIDGDIQAQMQERDSRFAHIEWPRPRMLDVEKKYVAIPSQHDEVAGTAIRIIVPLT